MVGGYGGRKKGRRLFVFIEIIKCLLNALKYEILKKKKKKHYITNNIILLFIHSFKNALLRIHCTSKHSIIVIIYLLLLKMKALNSEQFNYFYNSCF